MLTVIGANITVARYAHSLLPNRFASWQIFGVTQFIALVAAVLLFIFYGWPWAVALLVVSLITYFLLRWFSASIKKLREEDREVIDYSEQVLAALSALDVQINHVLGHLMDPHDLQNIPHEVEDAMRFLLYTLAKALELGPGDDSHLSVILATEGRMEMLAAQGVSGTRGAAIGDKFSYSPHPVRGTAGLTAERLETVYIPDLADGKNPDADYWVRLEPNESKKGSIICVPVRREIADTPEEQILAVLSITSIQTGTFDSEDIRAMIDTFVEKAETLIYGLRVAQSLETEL